MTSITPATRFALSGRVISDGKLKEDSVVAIDGHRIAFAGNPTEFAFWEQRDEYELIELPAGHTIVPGLIDLHCHGAVGGDFPGGDAEAIGRAIGFLHSSGTTTLLASLVTGDRNAMLEQASVLAGFCETGDLAGIHAEGPFLSHARCGAQDPAYLSDPEPDFVDELIGAARGQLRTMTYAPELNGSDALVEQLASQGVVPSLGHTDADALTVTASLNLAREELASAGFDGFTESPTITHLFNAMPPLHHRSPGPVAACLEMAAAGEAVIELIADGTHLSPDLVRTVFSLVGARNIALVTDSMAAAGLGDGSYELGPARVTVLDGEARLSSNGALAGGTATMLQLIQRTVAAGVPLEDAVTSATAVPASVLGLSDEAGRLHQGFVADLLVLDEQLGLHSAYRRGTLLEKP